MSNAVATTTVTATTAPTCDGESLVVSPETLTDRGRATLEAMGYMEELIRLLMVLQYGTREDQRAEPAFAGLFVSTSTTKSAMKALIAQASTRISQQIDESLHKIGQLYCSDTGDDDDLDGPDRAQRIAAFFRGMTRQYHEMMADGQQRSQRTNADPERDLEWMARVQHVQRWCDTERANVIADVCAWNRRDSPAVASPPPPPSS